MARIADEDIAAVRDRVNLADVVSQQVTLRNAGAGTLKGLCPFHDERTPSFTVSTTKNMYHCHGCGEGGDAIRFVMTTENLPFVDAVRRLADIVGITLRVPSGAEDTHAAARAAAITAHRLAADYYAGQLALAEAAPAREFLASRGFGAEHAAAFDVGYSPASRRALLEHLTQHGVSTADAIAAGLAVDTGRGVRDRFHGRLMWPIRDQHATIVGFGARALAPDAAPKYLNTPETVLYKKSRLLFGLDLARKDIARTRRAVIVEGYTDVMACHAAGITVAVATCGTAFSDAHVQILRRLLVDDGTAEVIFTFDGDEAGQKAALRTFHGGDTRFSARTFAAVAPGGQDPCDLRLTSGDAALHSMIDAKVPLAEFALRRALDGADATTPDGQAAALHKARGVLDVITDPVLRSGYERLTAEWLGLTVDHVAAAATPGSRPPAGQPAAPATRKPVAAASDDRDLIRLAVHHPRHLHRALIAARATLEQLLTTTTGRDLAAAIAAAGGLDGPAAHTDAWATTLAAHTPEPLQGALAACAVTPVIPPDEFDGLRISGKVDEASALARTVVRHLAARSRERRIAELLKRRRDPTLDPAQLGALDDELVALRLAPQT